MQPVFVLIKCEPGKAYGVASQIVEDVEETSEVYTISGEYDLLAKFYVEPDVDIGHFVCETVQVIPHIRDTFTLIALNAFGGQLP